jgi:hypothetical protein
MKICKFRTASQVVAQVLFLTVIPAAAQSDTPDVGEKQRGLGIVLDDDQDSIVVRAIRPDSIAAKSNGIDVGDRLTALKIGDKKTSLVGKSARDVRDLVRRASYDEPRVTIWLVPPNGDSESKVTLRRSIADVESDPSLYRLKIDVPTSIEQVVREFNEKAKHHTVGKSQPPITAAEVVAAIRRLRQEDCPSWTDEVFNRFLAIADTEEIPEGSELSFITRYHGIRGFDITVWCVDLRIATGPGSTNGFRIRDRTFASRAMTADEKSALERLAPKILEQHPERLAPKILEQHPGLFER